MSFPILRCTHRTSLSSPSPFQVPLPGPFHGAPVEMGNGLVVEQHDKYYKVLVVARFEILDWHFFAPIGATYNKPGVALRATPG